MSKIDVAGNMAAVQDRIAAACIQAGRSEQDVTLVAVSKRIDASLVADALELGPLILGENRVPEALDRRPELARVLAERRIDQENLTWHFIGHIQSRKAAQVVGAFDLLHGVDSLKLANRLAQNAVAMELNQPILLEVNITGEDQKHGLAPEELVEAAGRILTLPNLTLQGLMCMARYGADKTELHTTFAGLRRLAEEAARQLGTRLPQLSMGMSGDFEVAIAEGATMVRVGSAIFGPRNA